MVHFGFGHVVPGGANFSSPSGWEDVKGVLEGGVGWWWGGMMNGVFAVGFRGLELRKVWLHSRLERKEPRNTSYK